jgi:hypothetical protein
MAGVLPRFGPLLPFDEFGIKDSFDVFWTMR